jgi:RNA polymerase sigma factor (sigma-70 family)
MDEDGRTWFDKFLSGLKKGDSSAWNEAFRRYYTWLKRWTRGRLSPRLRPRIDTSDIAAEAIAGANRGIGDFKGRDQGAFESWLRGIVKNVFRQVIRDEGRIKRKSKGQQSLHSGLMNGSAFATGQPQSSTADLSDLLKLALDLLNEVERRRFLLYHDEGLSYAQIVLQETEPVTETALRTQVMRTRNKLKKIIEVIRRMDDELFLEDQKRAICLSFFQHKEAAEISRKLNVPEACIEHWIDDARAQGLLGDGGKR